VGVAVPRRVGDRAMLVRRHRLDRARMRAHQLSRLRLVTATAREEQSLTR
jgi:hypothetical protein